MLNIWVYMLLHSISCSLPVQKKSNLPARRVHEAVELTGSEIHPFLDDGKAINQISYLGEQQFGVKGEKEDRLSLVSNLKDTKLFLRCDFPLRDACPT